MGAVKSFFARQVEEKVLDPEAKKEFLRQRRDVLIGELLLALKIYLKTKMLAGFSSTEKQMWKILEEIEKCS